MVVIKQKYFILPFNQLLYNFFLNYCINSEYQISEVKKQQLSLFRILNNMNVFGIQIMHFKKINING